jgi:benzylsuccinate CoA-transferase BbsE subunit
MTETRMLPGCRVVDLTDEKGWFSGHLLAGMGAEVIRLDPPGRAPLADYGRSGQLAITLDIEKPVGRDLFRRLISQSDVLLESQAPGYLKSLALDYAALGPLNPALIMASITPFGQHGPSSNLKSSALSAAAAGGQLYLNGEPDRPPLPLYGPQAYLTAGLFTANGVLLALRERRQGGRGQYLDISIQECTAGTLDHALVRFFSLGEIARRSGRRYWNNTFQLLRCRDGWVGISFLQPWDSLVSWMEAEGLAADLSAERWQDPAERQQNIPHIIEIMEKWTLTHNAEELVETGQLMRLPWAAVATLKDVLNNPQLKAREYWEEEVDPRTGKLWQIPGAPVKMSASAWLVNSQLPPAAEWKTEFYRNRLGLSADEIAQLQAAGVI